MPFMPIRARLILMAFLMPFAALALQRGGSMAASETWRISDSPVQIGELLTVNRGATLTLEPGVEVQFAASAGLVVEGRLMAKGTAVDSIRFTTLGEKKPGAWGGIYIRGTWEEPDDMEKEARISGESSELDYCIIEYAGSDQVEVGSALEVTSAGPTISHSTVRFCHSRSGTVRCGNISRPIIKNCVIESNQAERGGAISAGVGSVPILQGNIFRFNRSDDHGGAIYISLANVELTSNEFLNNEAGGHGGAIYAAVSPRLILRQNVFSGNSAQSGSNTLYLTKRIDSEIKDNLFDSQDSTSMMIYLNESEKDLDASGNYWGPPESFFFKDAIHDRYDVSSELFVYYVPALWAPPSNLPTNPTRVDSIILCRNDRFNEEIPRGVAEGAILRIRLDGVDSDPFSANLIKVLVTSESDAEGIVIPLRETTANSGIFVGRGRVSDISDQMRYAIGSREGGEVALVAPFAPEVKVVYQTMSPKPLAENLDIKRVPNEDIFHIINHNPEFVWGYFDVLETPQQSFQIKVFPLTGDKPSATPIWDSGEIKKGVKEIVYAGEPLADGDSYVVRLKVKNDQFWSDEISLNFRVNSLPTAPRPAAPKPDELMPTLTPELSIGISTDREGDSLRYDFELFRARDSILVGEIKDIKASDGVVNWKLADALTENLTYYYRARAKDPLEEGSWSDNRIFHINSIEEPPNPFDPDSPINGTKVYLLHPTLVWQVAVDPDPLSSVTYTVEIDKSADFTSARIYANLTAVEFALPDSLDNLTGYYWRVTANDNTGRRTLSRSLGQFFVDTTPTVPVPLAPLAGEERMPPDSLTWQASTDPNPEDLIFYEVEIYEAQDLVKVVATIAGRPETFVPVNLLSGWDQLIDNHVYYWRVRSRDNHSAASQFSTAGSFFFNRYNDVPAPVAAFIAPRDTVTGSNEVHFVWTAASDPDLSDPPSSLVYELQCSLAGFDGPEVQNFASDAGRTELKATLTDNRMWNCRIRTRDNENAVSLWSAVKTFLVNVAEDPPLPFALVSPGDGSAIAELDSLLFEWEATSDPDWQSSVHYRFELLPKDWNPIITDTKETRSMFKGGLTNESNYSWRVIAIDNTGLETVCSAGFRFHTSTTPTAPAAASMPEELMPKDPLAFTGSTDPNLNDRLTYALEIGTDSTFSQTLVQLLGKPHAAGTMTAVIETLPGQEKLLDDVDYWFRIRATDNHKFYGPYSQPAIFRFNRINDPPGPAQPPMEPVIDAVVRDQKPTLTWGAASDGDLSDPPSKLAYDLRLDSDGEVEKSSAYTYSTGEGQTSFPIPAPLKDNTPWVWQIRTRDNDGAVSPWSATIPFLVNVMEDPPTPPALKKPLANEKLNILGPIVLVWGASSDPDWKSSVTYRVEYDTAETLTNPERIDGLKDTSFTIAGPLLNTSYHWRVTAVDNTSLETASALFTFIIDSRPSVPELIVPAGLFEVNPESKLSWTTSIDPNPNDKISYELAVGVEFGNLAADVTSTGEPAKTVDASMSQVMGDNQIFNWRVRAVDDHGISSDWSNSSKFFYNAKNDPPNAVPGLIEPAPAAEVAGLKFSWQPASDVDFSDTPGLLSYRVELSQDSSFYGSVITLNTKPGVTSTTGSGLVDDSRWFWRVLTVDDESAVSPASSVGMFVYNLQNDAPGAVPKLLTPADGAEVGSASLTWAPAPDPDIYDSPDKLSYRVELSQHQDFSGGIMAINTQSGVASAAPAGLTDDTRWFWRVKAVDRAGALGPVSEVRSFIYNAGNNPPGGVSSLLWPADEQNVNTLTLSWGAATDPDLTDPQETLTYTVELARDKNFGAGVVTLSTPAGITTLQPANLADNARWFWRVRAVDKSGAAGLYSRISGFVYNTVNDPPGFFNLTAPVNGAETSAGKATVRWTASADPDPGDKVSYAVYVATDAAFGANMRKFGGIAGTEYQIPSDALSTGGLFYWKVAAEDGNGAVTWGSGSDAAPWSFSVKKR